MSGIIVFFSTTINCHQMWLRLANTLSAQIKKSITTIKLAKLLLTQVVRIAKSTTIKHAKSIIFRNRY